MAIVVILLEYFIHCITLNHLWYLNDIFTFKFQRSSIGRTPNTVYSTMQQLHTQSYSAVIIEIQYVHYINTRHVLLRVFYLMSLQWMKCEVTIATRLCGLIPGHALHKHLLKSVMLVCAALRYCTFAKIHIH